MRSSGSQQRSASPVLLTTHYLEEADKLAQQLVIVDQGRIVASGTPEALKSELGGDSVTVEVELESDVPRAVSALEQLGSVAETTVDRRTVKARVQNGPSAIPVVLQVLEAGGVTVSSVVMARPSLDDVYLRHTGRSFERAQREGGQS